VPEKVKNVLRDRQKARDVMLYKFSMVRTSYIYQCIKSINPDQEIGIIDPQAILEK